nr:MAG TPA: hypothetical protein [Caudoviricetes sp.]
MSSINRSSINAIAINYSFLILLNLLPDLKN